MAFEVYLWVWAGRLRHASCVAWWICWRRERGRWQTFPVLSWFVGFSRVRKIVYTYDQLVINLSLKGRVCPVFGTLPE
jgi:hypothetical protein